MGKETSRSREEIIRRRTEERLGGETIKSQKLGQKREKRKQEKRIK